MKPSNSVSLRAPLALRLFFKGVQGRSNPLLHWGAAKILFIIFSIFLLTSCATVDLNAPIPQFDTGIDPASWALVPAGTFYHGQAAELEEIPYAYEIMVTDVTVTQY